MSYRAFKRLLGETSLERKCRFLLGTGILLLMTFSFWVYARQTENIAYEQTTTTGRLMVSPVVARAHVPKGAGRDALEKYQVASEANWPDALKDYRNKIIKPDAQKPEHKAEGDEQAILNLFLANPGLSEETRTASGEGHFYYYAAVRAGDTCLKCHPHDSERAAGLTLKEGDLMAVVSIRLSTKAIETSFHINRALLISTALLTALLIMAGSYLIVRYVIVKPVKHLKEVSDAIAGGHLNVRSEIQTGDEFEDLSHAFNRMLRNLVSMQERYQKLNADLDRKVDELAHANMALYESNRLKSDFLATMSHELRTPLNSILGFSDVLLGNTHQLNEKQARWVVNIKSSGQQLLNLINEILALAKIEAGKMDIHAEEFALRELCDNLVAMFRPLTEKKNIELRAHYGPDLPRVRQDAGKLRQIVSNLLSNAVKFTPEGGRVSVSADAAGEDFTVTVADSGVGIAPEDQELVFEKFRQAGNPLTREHEGTGLGLSIVRELSKLLGGDVTVKSELGRGSTFVVRLPVRVREEARSEFDLPLSQLILPNGRAFDALQPDGAAVTASEDGQPNGPAAAPPAVGDYI